MPRFAVAVLVPLILLTLVSAGRADVDVEVRNADQVKGTLDPGTETETFRLNVPDGARLTLSAKGTRKGPVASLVLHSPTVDDVATGDSKGRIRNLPAAGSGEYRAVVTSQGAAKTGDYAFSAKWSSLRKFGPGTLAFTGGDDLTFPFAADAGARVRITVTSKSAARPRVLSIAGPGGDVPGVDDGSGGAVEKTPSIVLPATGAYLVTVRDASDGLAAGDATITVQITPPKASKRKIDLTAKTTGTGGGDGAFARVVDAAGGTITVPEGLDGLGAIAGSSVSIGAGVLPSGAAIVVATAPPIKLQDGTQSVGPPVYFGPEGLKLGTASNPGAVLSIPVDLGPVGGDRTQIRVYTRNSKGKVEEVDYALLDFDSEPGFVRFPTSHFSSYVAAADLGPSGANLVSIVRGLAAVTDVATNLTADDPTRVYFFADGSSRAKEVVFDVPAYSVRNYAGGGGSVPNTLYEVPKEQADFGGPVVAVASAGDAVYIGTATAVFRVDVASGKVARFAGTGVAGDSGDLGPATSAQISSCADILEDSQGDVWIVDSVAARVRRVNVSGFIETFAGTGAQGSNGDGNPATSTLLDQPTGIVEQFVTNGYFLCERGRVRSLDTGQNSVLTLAGDPNGARGCAAEGASGTSARFDGLNSIVLDPVASEVLVGSDACDVLYGIATSTGTVSVRLGVVQSPGFQNDGGFATPPRVTNPRIVLGSQGFLVLVDYGGGAGDTRIRYFVQE